MIRTIITATAFLAAGGASALAHVTLEGHEASVGSTYKAVFRVPNSCEG